MFTRIKQILVVWLMKKIQKYGPHKVNVLGRSYEISEQVFNPKFYFTSKFMAEHIRVMPDDVILDMGTGSGIQAITAAQIAAEVVAIDINPEAVRFARKNIRANGVEHVVSVIEGNLFTPLSPYQKFSVILFTPPYLAGKSETVFDYALFDSNKELIKRFFREADGHLKPRGYVQMLYSSIAGHGSALQIAETSGWKHKLIAREETRTENFLIYRLTRE